MCSQIIDHTHKTYIEKRNRLGSSKYNGAFYYSKEIVKNIIPNVNTDRNWVTVNQQGYCFDHSIVFIHNNLHPNRYDWIADYKDLILVCGVPETCEKVEHLGIPIYLPLSVDVDYIKTFMIPEEEKYGTAFAGRYVKSKYGYIPPDVDYICGLDHRAFLQRIAYCKKLYAVGRVAIEGLVLGCEILPYDERYPDPSVWKVLDNKDAASMLQDILDGIDS